MAINNPFSERSALGIDSLNDAGKAVLAGFALDKLQNALQPPKPRVTSADDPLALSNFTAMLATDGFRMHKGYYYQVHFVLDGYSDSALVVQGQSGAQRLSFHCQDIVLPGWRSNTQKGKIYGLEYEVPVNIEQDPIWISFNVDIRTNIMEYFFDRLRIHMFGHNKAVDGENVTNDYGSYSPKYKDEIKFTMTIELTDENFKVHSAYRFDDCIFKTVQNTQLGMHNAEFSKVAVEVVYESYERIDLTSNAGVRADKQSNRGVVDKNRLTIGPFNADVSPINQRYDMLKKIPKWFSGPTKI